MRNESTLPLSIKELATREQTPRKNMAKITLIGAGSVVFAKNLIGDILQHPALAESTICLMDIDSDRLKVAKVMAERIVETLGVKAKIEATTSRRRSIKGADYVICTIQVGGYEPGTVIDFEIPARYGLKQTIADTLGVGGVFRALRTIPELVKIAEDIAKVASPGCIFLNYTNPMAMNCMAIDRAVGVPHVGLCHSVQGTSKNISKYAGLPYEDVSFLVAGINHMAFFLKFEYKGQDAYPLLFRAMENPQVFARDKVRFEMMRRLGFFVTESSEHQSEYTPHFIHHGQSVIDEFDIPIDEYLRRCEAIIATWKETESTLLGEDGAIEVSQQTHEYGSFIINAKETNTPTVVYGNVPNRDLITNLPANCCVEVPTLVDKNGLQPVRIGTLPPQIAAICRSNINVQELTVEAALTSKREHIYHAVMADPHTAATLPLDKIWAMCDELIEAHQKVGLLGEYEPVVKNTGRSFAGIGDRVLATLEPEGTFDPSSGASNAYTLVVENQSAKSLELSFRLSSDCPDISFSRTGKLTKKLAPGKTYTQAVRAKNKQDTPDQVSIDLHCSDSSVLCKGASVSRRKVVPADDDGQVAFSLELAGNLAAAARLSKTQTGLRLQARVEDSDLKDAYRAHRAWFGSRLELHIATDASSPIHSVYLVPGQGKAKPKAVDYDLAPIPSAKLKQRKTPMYYTLDAALPYEALGISKEHSSLLVDLVCGLGALGDAHSGGETSLSGNTQRGVGSAAFWQAEF